MWQIASKSSICKKTPNPIHARAYYILGKCMERKLKTNDVKTMS